MNKDKIAGAIKEAGGTVREKVAEVTHDRKAHALGEKDRLEGKVQKNYGEAKDTIKKAAGD